MALVTKQYLYETVSALLEGGNPSAGKKFEPRMVQAFIQQAINRKLKTEYLSVTLPSDETIPEGLMIACYNDIPVATYKNNLSRAKLPAMPISLRKNMGVYFVGPASGGNINPLPVPSTGFTIQAAVGITEVVVGTTETITGIVNGSSIVTSNAFANIADTDFEIIRGNFPVPSIDPLDGNIFFTKVKTNNYIQFSAPLSLGEYLKIKY